MDVKIKRIITKNILTQRLYSLFECTLDLLDISETRTSGFSEKIAIEAEVNAIVSLLDENDFYDDIDLKDCIRISLGEMINNSIELSITNAL